MPTGPAQPPRETFATLNIPSVGSPLPIYTPTPNGQWSLICYTPCTLRVAVGNVTIATISDGRDAVTIPVPPEGRSYQPEFTQRPAATVVNPSGYSGAQSLASIGVTPAQLSEHRNGPGLSPGGVVFVAGLSVSVVSVVVGTVAFVNLGTRSSSGLWSPVFYGSIVGLLVGGVLTTVGTYMGISYNSSGSQLAFAPILSPQMQGVGMSIRF